MNWILPKALYIWQKKLGLKNIFKLLGVGDLWAPGVSNFAGESPLAQAAILLHQLPSQVILHPVVKCKRSASTSHLKTWTLSDLPKGCNVNDIFRLILSPTYLQMLSHHKWPFSIPDKDDLAVMQAIFSHIYQTHQEYTIKIEPSFPVFGVVTILFAWYYLY